MMSLLAMSFGDRFYFNRKGRIGGGGWVHPKGANSMAASGLISRNDLVGTGRARVRNKRSHLVSQHSRPVFQLRQVGISQDLTRRLLIGGCDQSHVSIKDG